MPREGARAGGASGAIGAKLVRQVSVLLRILDIALSKLRQMPFTSEGRGG